MNAVLSKNRYSFGVEQAEKTPIVAFYSKKIMQTLQKVLHFQHYQKNNPPWSAIAVFLLCAGKLDLRSNCQTTKFLMLPKQIKFRALGTRKLINCFH